MDSSLYACFNSAKQLAEVVRKRAEYYEGKGEYADAKRCYFEAAMHYQEAAKSALRFGANSGFLDKEKDMKMAYEYCMTQVNLMTQLQFIHTL